MTASDTRRRARSARMPARARGWGPAHVRKAVEMRSATVLAALAAAATLAAQAQPQPPQQQAPVFRTTTETVAVPTTVFDRYGELVTSLTRDDFKVFDDGHRQPITNFTSGLQSISAVVLVDTSASMTHRARAGPRRRRAVHHPAASGRPRHASAPSTTRSSSARTFTGDRDVLLRTLRENHRFANPTRLFDAVDEAMTLLEPLGGRRVVVVLTDGCDTGSKPGWDTFRRRFMSEEQMLYIVQFRPRVRPTRPRRAASGSPAANRTSTGRSRPASRSRSSSRSTTRARSSRRRRFSTGCPAKPAAGASCCSTRTMSGPTFTRISDELHYLYLLGFVPEKRDGKTHELTVTLADKTMRVRARRSYLAPLEPAAGRNQHCG